MNSYITSFANKIERLFWNKELSNIISLYDECGEKLDHVLFIELTDGGFVGVFIDGANPLLSVNKVSEFDDFNLYANYQKLEEKGKDCFNMFRVEHISLVFCKEYNELLGIRLSSSSFNQSLLLLFMQDEIYIEQDIYIASLNAIIAQQFRHFSIENIMFIEKTSFSDNWHNV